MNFTPEQITKAKAAKSVEELLAIAKENGMELTEEEAAKYFAEWHKEGELSDEELNNVSGGCGSSDPPAPRYKEGKHLWVGFFTTQSYVEFVVDAPEFYDKENGWRYLVSAVDYDYQDNYYLETRSYVHTTDPGPGWHN